MARQKALMHGAVALPKQDAASGQPVLRLPALPRRPWIPDHHLVERNPHRMPRVAPQMLVGQKENPLAAGETPLHRLARVRRGAHQPAVLSAECFNRCRRVDVGNGYRFIRRGESASAPHPSNLPPARSPPYRPSSSPRSGRAESPAGRRGASMSALSAIKCTPQKTMYLASVCRGGLRQLVAVAGEVGEAHHLIALVVVAQNHRRRAQPRARLQQYARPSCGREVPGSSQGCKFAASAAGTVDSSRTKVTMLRLQSDFGRGC